MLIDSGFGKTLIFATDGQMPYPWGRETTGYEVRDLDATILKAEARRRLCQSRADQCSRPAHILL
ncbi:MAG: hypothetical protein WDN29_03540 [Methylovirgula sp.]